MLQHWSQWKRRPMKIQFHIIISHHHYQSLAAEQIYDNFPLCLHPSLSAAARLSATQQLSYAKLCSMWILLLPLVGLPLILPSILSCKRPPCLKTWPIHQSFAKQSSVYACLRLLFWQLIQPAILSILLHIHTSKTSNFILSVSVYIIPIFCFVYAAITTKLQSGP